MLSSFLSKNILEKRLLVSAGNNVMEYSTLCTLALLEKGTLVVLLLFSGSLQVPFFLERHNNGKRKSANPYFLPLTFVLLFLQI